MMRTAIVSIALGMAIMILAIVITRGFSNEISKKMFDLWGHIYVSGAYVSQTYETRPMILDRSLISNLEEVDITDEAGGRFNLVTPVVMYSGILQANGELDGQLFKGVSEDYLSSKLGQHAIRALGNKTALDNRMLAISTYVANRFQLDTADVVNLHFVKNNQFFSRKFRIGLIYNTSIEEYDKHLCFMRLDDLQSCLSWHSSEIGGYELFADNVLAIDTLDKYIVEEVLPIELFSVTIKEKYSNMFQWFDMLRGTERMIVYFFLGVCMINLVTILLVLLLEKLNFIGIMKAMGLRDGKLRQIFVLLGVRILLIGLFWGNLLGILLAWIQKQYRVIKLNEANYFIAYAPIEFSWQSIIWLNVLILISGIFILVIPSYYIARFKPTQILRFK